MEKLKRSLATLLNEKRSIGERLDELTEKDNPNHVRGLRKAVLTAILMCAYPCHYAVYNGISAAALKQLGRTITTDVSLGQQYVQLNNECLRLAEAADRPLWLIDVMFSKIGSSVESLSKHKIKSQTPRRSRCQTG